MKPILFLSALLSFSTFAFAEVDSLVSLRDPKIVVKTAGGLAAVQPSAYITFEYASCAKQPLYITQAEVITDRKITYVSVYLPDSAYDCAGMPVKRTYSFQLTSDFSEESYAISNPLIPSFR